MESINVNKNTSLSKLGYKTSIYKPDGSVYVSINAVLNSVLAPKDGSLILLTTSSLNSSKTLSGIIIAIDVNGPKGPNKLGKDVFKTKVSFFDGVFSMERPISARIKTLQDGSVVVEKFEYDNMTRTEHINYCKTEGRYCGLLIQQDGWEIKDDYPW